MSDIFLSYASEDRSAANRLADALSAQGWNVWWDRTILPGKTFDKVIEHELSTATCVIVLWSGKSVESPWVRAEAGEALNRGLLIPALLDDATIPLVFRQIQAAPLADWRGDAAHPGFQQLVNAISALVPPSPVEQAPVRVESTQQSAPEAQDSTDSPSTRRRHVSIPAWLLAVALVVPLAGLIGWLTLQRTPVPAPLPVVDTGETELIATVTAPGSGGKETQTTPPMQVEPPAPSAAPAGGSTSQSESRVEQAAPEPDTPVQESITPSPVAAIPAKPSPPKKAVVKPAPAVAPAPQPEPETPAPRIAALAPAPQPEPLPVALVVWGMPKDEGIASPEQTETYSTRLAKALAEIADEVIPGAARFTYVYPGERHHHALRRDRGDFEESREVCRETGADIAVFAFVKGSEFDSTIGWVAERKPFFAVFDCATRQRVSRTYTVHGSRSDSFPYAGGLQRVFREFAAGEGALARYAKQ